MYNKQTAIGKGRPTNGIFRLATTHPLYETHVLRLRSKIAIPVPVNTPPRYPPCKPIVLTTKWKTQARSFARYYLALFRPWKLSPTYGSLPGSMTWRNLCDFLLQLEEGENHLGPSTIDTARLGFIHNMSHGLKMSTANNKAAAAYRFRKATNWLIPDCTAPLRNKTSADFQNQNASHDERELEEKKKEEEAALAIDLLRSMAAQDLTTADNKETLFLNNTAASLHSIFSGRQSRNSYQTMNLSDSKNVIHCYPENEPDVAMLISNLKDSNFTPEEEENDLDEQMVHGLPATLAIATDVPSKLNQQQQTMLNICTTYVDQKFLSPNASNQEIQVPHLFIEGGPGTGKTFFVQTLYDHCKKNGLTVATMAPTAIAANNLPGGRTCHSTFCFHIDLSKIKFQDDLCIDQLNHLRKRLNPETLAFLIIDEASNVSPDMLAQIEKRVKQLCSNDLPFGGLAVVMLGDSLQLPPVATTHTLFSAIVTQRLSDSNTKLALRLRPLNILNDYGAHLFSNFKRFEFTEQMRCAGDKEHTALLCRMRQSTTAEQRITQQDIDSIPVLSSEDIANDPLFLTATTVVTNNTQRCLINNIQSQIWAEDNNVPRFVWRIPLENMNNLSKPLQDFVYKKYQHLTSYFVQVFLVS